MAFQTNVVFLLLSVIIGVLSISATARPCKTIFFITSSSSSYYPTDDHPNPNNSPQLTFFITEIHRTTSFSVDRSSDDAVSSKSPSSSSSVQDITLDILSVIGSLLFGVGCGALTAVTLYLITRRNASDDDEDDDDEDDDDEDDVSPNGYTAIPTTTTTATKEVPPSADEVDAMKA